MNIISLKSLFLFYLMLGFQSITSPYRCQHPSQAHLYDRYHHWLICIQYSVCSNVRALWHIQRCVFCQPLLPCSFFFFPPSSTRPSKTVTLAFLSAGSLKTLSSQMSLSNLSRRYSSVLGNSDLEMVF